MKTEFIPYEQSLELKDLGFDKPCFGYYVKGDEYENWTFYREGGTFFASDFPEHILAPTFSQAFRWFREKYNWQHSIDPTSDQHSFELGYNYWIWNYKTGEEYHTMPKNRPTGDWEFETYEEAELACLKKIIEILKNEQ